MLVAYLSVTHHLLATGSHWGTMSLNDKIILLGQGCWENDPWWWIHYALFGAGGGIKERWFWPWSRNDWRLLHTVWQWAPHGKQTMRIWSDWLFLQAFIRMGIHWNLEMSWRVSAHLHSLCILIWSQPNEVVLLPYASLLCKITISCRVQNNINKIVPCHQSRRKSEEGRERH